MCFSFAFAMCHVLQHTECAWCDQIPGIADAPDFDPRNPTHLRVFEAEMIDMMTIALEKQARIQRNKRTVNNSAIGKMTEHEIDLATRGLDVPQVRQIQAVGESHHIFQVFGTDTRPHMVADWGPRPNRPSAEYTQPFEFL